MLGAYFVFFREQKIARKEDNILLKKALETSGEAKIKRERPREMWIEVIEEFRRRRGKTLNELKVMANDNSFINSWKNRLDPHPTSFNI